MALTDIITYYYYFHTPMVGAERIEKTITPMIGFRWVELTDEQREFYLANPTATVNEVKQCHLDPPPTPPDPDIDEVREQALNDLKFMYADKMGRYSDLQVVGAISSHYALTTLTIGDNVPYTLSEAKNIIEGFNSLMKAAKQVYDRHKSAIEAATTKEVIAAELETAKEEMEAL